jgi:hypothetical protein
MNVGPRGFQAERTARAKALRRRLLGVPTEQAVLQLWWSKQGTEVRVIGNLADKHEDSFLILTFTLFSFCMCVVVGIK